MMDRNIALEIINEIGKNPKDITTIKKKVSKKHNLNYIPTNIEIITYLNKEERNKHKNTLFLKPTRTISGVAPIAIMTAPFKCPAQAQCTYCPGGPNSYFGDIPKSYTGNEPATMRGLRANFDAYIQVFNRLQQYTLLNHIPEKAEIIIMGGTFTAYPKDYQDKFVTEIYKAMNDFSDLFYKTDFDYDKFKEFFELPGDKNNKDRENRIQKKLLQLKGNPNLEIEIEKNEKSKIRCIGLTIETRPDCGLLIHGNAMLKYGCTRVELGIQSVYDKALNAVKRGHNNEISTKSIQILKDLGFKLNFHYMPGLPETNKEKDLEGLKQLFSNPNYRPDMLKIYPCMVMPGTELEKDYKEGKYTPITTKEASILLTKFTPFIEPYCRIMRVQRDIPTKFTEAGVDKTNLRQYLDKERKQEQIKCKCIRCREPKGKEISWSNIKIKVQEYSASKGHEFFISAEDMENDILIGFVRMRFPSESLRKEITETSAIIRELHVYGTALKLGSHGSIQHKGYGKQLMEKAELIAKENNKNKMVIISGIGVKEYYINQLGYSKDGPYVSKDL